MNELNLKSSTVEKGLDLLKDMMSKVLGPTFNELGELWSDNVKIWRLNNQIRNLNKVKRIVEKHNIDIKQINVKVLLPYLEGVSLEDDETLQDMWADLFANYIDASKNLTVIVYPNILKQLSTLEVKIIKYLRYGKNKVDFADKFDIGDEIINHDDFSNLLRLGVVEAPTRYSIWNRGDNQEPSYDLEEVGIIEYRLSNFGWDFIKACSR